jgi:long-chain acyl-CoA synthetase
MLDPTKAPQTIAELAQRSFVRFVDRPCLGAKDRATKTYKYLSYGEVGTRVRHVAGGLVEMGLSRGDRVAILAESAANGRLPTLPARWPASPACHCFDFAASQIAGILRDSGAVMIVVSDAAQLQKVQACARTTGRVATHRGDGGGRCD